MTDYFALLDEPRRPWLDTELLKQKFLTLSTSAHPDRFHSAPEPEREAAGNRYSKLNAAWQCLRDPKERLRHLLELERGARAADIQSVPPEMTDQFFEVGHLYREANTFLAEKAKVTSPVLQAQMFARGAEWMDQIGQMQQKINFRREELLTELKTINFSWESSANAGQSVREPLLERLEAICRLLGYFGRWSEQLQQKMVQLTF